MLDDYMNAVPTPKGSVRPAGRSVPVIARFVLLDGSEEWRPCTAARWTDRAVLVSCGDRTFGQDYTWLPVEDVARVLRPGRPDDDRAHD
ncbi:hypothetical protein [Nakamurella endophytica]|uniref:hypothetical protein n=1 Tax=Nakamurella endophytica TaxID=1748367 RepID=UPI00166E238F|nr:hypothetical protein [Nakamurella endophytica]